MSNDISVIETEIYIEVLKQYIWNTEVEIEVLEDKISCIEAALKLIKSNTSDGLHLKKLIQYISLRHYRKILKVHKYSLRRHMDLHSKYSSSPLRA